MALLHNERKAEAVAMLHDVRKLLARAGVKIVSGWRQPRRTLESCDLAISIGGDGTMLQCARLLAPLGTPVLGLNAGGLGFLSSLDFKDFQRELKRIFSSGFVVENRWMLSVEVRRGARALFGPETALNDCVVRCHDQARAVLFRIESRRRQVADIFGDGVIVATPTGSTAYALAVGGPVVVPGVDAFLLAPVGPHALTMRPIVTPAWYPISIRVERKNPYDRPQALVSLDGQIQRSIRVGDEVHIRREDHPFKLLVPPERSHFDLLRRKLKWGQR